LHTFGHFDEELLVSEGVDIFDGDPELGKILEGLLGAWAAVLNFLLSGGDMFDAFR
jgi:hypothetical protein